MSVTVEGLTKAYGLQLALDSVSFSLLPGEVTGFLGPNGAGKSTTFKLLTGYLRPTAGTVRVLNYRVPQDSLAAKRCTGYLPEHNPLYLDLYVREFLSFVAALHGLRGKNRTSSVERVIEQTGLGPEVGKPIGALSKGYRQRVGLAQALIHNPPVLLLDEPTGGLDPNQVQDIRALVRELGKDKTVLFSSHILQEVEAVANRILILHRGRLVHDGPVQPGLEALFQQVTREEVGITHPHPLQR